jgi:hypothetical protein
LAFYYFRGELDSLEKTRKKRINKSYSLFWLRKSATKASIDLIS